jgi:NEDD4-binding protein 2
MSKTLIIMRGLPGSGKSTRARELQEKGVIHSTDTYFTNPLTGEYKFDFEKTKEYHQNNLEDAIESMEAGISPVIIDNTNTQRWEFQKYLDAAEEFGYDVKIETLDPTNYSEDFTKELAERQKKTHNVPEQVIIDMLKRWED